MNILNDLIDYYGCNSKEDLQSYLGEFISIDMIKGFGEQCFDKAIDLASENVTIRICNIDGHEVPDGTIDKESILKLKIK